MFGCYTEDGFLWNNMLFIKYCILYEKIAWTPKLNEDDRGFMH